MPVLTLVVVPRTEIELSIISIRRNVIIRHIKIRVYHTFLHFGERVTNYVKHAGYPVGFNQLTPPA